MRSKSIFTGSCCAIVTPFLENGKVDYDSLEKLVEFQISGGTDAIIVCGTTGEASTMDDKEHLEVIGFVIEKVNGRVPVIAGAGSNDTRHGVNLCKEAEKLGADGLLLVTPYYNKTSQRGLIAHYTKMADSVNIPVILYNVPSRTGVNILPETLNELANHPNICAIKEASGNISQVAKMMSLCADRIDFYSGNDDMNVTMAALGAKGTISVLANVAPKQTHDMMKYALDGDYEKAAKAQLDAIELIEALFCDVNPIPVKAALNLMGMNAGTLRLPLYELSDANLERLKKAMENYGIL